MKKIKDAIKDAKFSVLYAFGGAMKGGNEAILSPVSESKDIDAVNVIGQDNVYAEMLRGEQTQRVRETVDAMYRVLREADKYDVKARIEFGEDGEDGDYKIVVESVEKKNDRSFFDRKINVYNPSSKEIRVVQDNKFIQKKTNFSIDLSDCLNTNVLDYDTTLSIERDNFIPRFKLEKFANKIVCFKPDEDGLCDIHIYTTMYASQFGKIDALYINEVMNKRNNPEYRTETFDISSISFITDKPYKSENMCEFKYDNIKFKGIEVYDGNFVLMFTGRCVVEEEYIGKKFETKELTEKYEKEEKKNDAVDIFAVKRKIEKDSQETDDYIDGLTGTRFRFHKINENK